jgi:regulator of replication initiation timing
MSEVEASIVPEVELRLLIASQAEEIRQLREDLSTLRVENHGLKGDLQKTRCRLIDAEMIQDELIDNVNKLSEIATGQLTPNEGTKTVARIAKLKEILKKRRGRASFSDLRDELKLSKSQFSQLTRNLDKRVFDVQRHPYNGKEKVLVLRQQIGRRA